MRFLKHLAAATVILASMLPSVTGCTGRSAHHEATLADSCGVDSLALVSPRHAKGFHVNYSDGVTLLEINDPEDREREKHQCRHSGGIRENRDTREERDMHDLPSAFELHKTRHNRYGMRNHEHTPSSQRQDEQTA